MPKRRKKKPLEVIMEYTVDSPVTATALKAYGCKFLSIKHVDKRIKYIFDSSGVDDAMASFVNDEVGESSVRQILHWLEDFREMLHHKSISESLPRR